jgi:hypothetical protein
MASDEPHEENTNPEHTAFEAEIVEESVTQQEESNGENTPTTPPAVAYNPAILIPLSKPQEPPPPPSPMANLAAKGGAVGALVLGGLALVGSFISSYAILNSAMGIAMGLWGLSSNHRRMATIGLVLCIVSAFFCVVEISSWLQTVWPQEEF